MYRVSSARRRVEWQRFPPQARHPTSLRGAETSKLPDSSGGKKIVSPQQKKKIKLLRGTLRGNGEGSGG